jgi:hypothetical protein
VGVRGQSNTFRENWINHIVDTPAGRLELTVFAGQPRFFGCTRLDGVPIAPADAHRLLEQVGDECGSMPYIGGR